MTFQLDGNYLPVGVAFKTSDGTQYPANWLTLSSADEKTAIGITEVTDPTYFDGRFYNGDGSAKSLTDSNATYPEDDPDGTYSKGDLVKYSDGTQVINYGVKSKLIQVEKETAASLLAIYDWQIIRKTEKGTAIDSDVTTFRDAVRAAYVTRKTEINNCADTASLINLYNATYDSDGKFVKFNMTQYPTDPNKTF